MLKELSSRLPSGKGAEGAKAGLKKRTKKSMPFLKPAPKITNYRKKRNHLQGEDV